MLAVVVTLAVNLLIVVALEIVVVAFKYLEQTVELYNGFCIIARLNRLKAVSINKLFQ